LLSVQSSVSHELSACRPCERRDPSPLASKVKKASVPVLK
jgi:hypothetical protein